MNTIAAMSLLLSSQAEAGAHGWAWLPCTTTGCTVYPDYQYNSGGGSITANRLSSGLYQVIFPELASVEGIAHVTAYSTNGSCQIRSWFPWGADELVYVGCHDSAGNPADQFFDVMFYEHGTWLAPNPYESAYIWVDLVPGAGTISTGVDHQYHSAGDTLTATRAGTGTYDVLVPNLHADRVVPTVSAYGATHARCAVSNWVISGTGLSVRVECTDSAGALFDSAFSLSMVAGAPGNADTGWLYRGAGLHVDSTGRVLLFPSWYDVPPYIDTSVSISHSATGTYDLTLPGYDPYHSTFLVTAQSFVRGVHCNPGFWYPNPTGTTLHVYCYDAAGAPHDSGFTLLGQTSQPR